jgi:SAM-dependent methyltransferase
MPSRRLRRRSTAAQRADRHRLYEASVQSPAREIAFVEGTYAALRGRRPRLLREDFCGTAAIAARWTRRHPGNRAWGVDLDPEVLAWGEKAHAARLPAGARARLELRQADVLDAHTPPVDVVLALNFSYWTFKDRPALRAYFAAAHRALKSDGVLILDAYGGSDAQRELRERTDFGRFTYVWHQAEYDPVTARYTCHIDFTFPDGSRLPKAFTYHWRLWTLPELRELLLEAGFCRATVYAQGYDEKTGEGDDKFLPTESMPADAAWIAYLVAER